jgi:glutamyl-tRNA reductase
MGMKYNPNESYEKWAERVRMYEHGYALQRIAKGETVDVVLEDMARRIMEKLMHPVIKHIQEVDTSNYDPVESRKNYEETYMKKYGPKADHILDEKVDKPE